MQSDARHSDCRLERERPSAFDENPGIVVDGVFDIETSEWDQFVLGGMLDSAGTYRSTTDQEELVDWLLSVGGQWWTWNGGLFDTLWLANRLRRRGLRFSCALAGPRVTRMECAGLVVRDAIALVPMSLAKAAPMAGIRLDKDTGLACVCGTDCGGYCAIRPNLAPHELRSLDAYLREDCRASLAILDTVQAEAKRCEYLLAGTIGAASYKTVAALAGIDRADWPNAQLFKAADVARFGGRVEVFRPQAAKGFAYDITSAYPAALTTVDLPTGAMLKLSGDKARRAFLRGKEGLYLACVNVPATMHVPPLPARTPGGRCIFPTGLFRGTWPGNELRAALERGVSAEIVGALVWSDAEPVLAPALMHLWECRARAKAEGNDSLAAWHKWFCNAPTGKLGERPDKERVIVNPTDDEVRECTCPPRQGRRGRRCYCGAWKPLDREGEVWAVPYWQISSCAHVHWNAYLTGATRVKLYDQLVDDGQGGITAVYCDTDSVKATAPRTNDIGDDIGQWKNEGDWTEFTALAPKLYRYRDAEGRWHVRGKGLPGLTADGFEAFRQGEQHLIDRGVKGLRSAARTGELFTRKRFFRTDRSDGLHFGGRILTPAGFTRPMDYKEFLKWEKQSQ